MLFGLEIHDVRQVDLQHLGAGEDPARIPGDGREGIGHLMQFRWLMVDAGFLPVFVHNPTISPACQIPFRVIFHPKAA
jgi:hypothetical protein